MSYGKGPGGSNANVSQSSCGILAYVNAVYYMTENFIQPSELAAWLVNNGYRINDIGTSLELYGAFQITVYINMMEFDDGDSVFSYYGWLKEGTRVLCIVQRKAKESLLARVFVDAVMEDHISVA